MPVTTSAIPIIEINQVLENSVQTSGLYGLLMLVKRLGASGYWKKTYLEIWTPDSIWSLLVICTLSVKQKNSNTCHHWFFACRFSCPVFICQCLYRCSPSLMSTNQSNYFSWKCIIQSDFNEQSEQKFWGILNDMVCILQLMTLVK